MQNQKKKKEKMTSISQQFIKSKTVRDVLR